MDQGFLSSDGENDGHPDSDSDVRIKAEQQMIHLEEQNSQLLKENNILHAQFEQAMQLTNELQEVRQKNQKLTSQVRTLQSEKEDLEHRFSIITKSKEELNNQLITDKRNYSQQRNHELAEMQKEIANNQKKYELIIENYKVKVKKLETEKEKVTVESRMMNNKLDKLLQSSTEYFSKNVDSIEQLIDILNTPRLNIPSSPTKPESPKIQKQIIESPSHKKCDNRRLKEARSQLENTKKELEEIKYELQREKQNGQHEINSLQEKIKELKDEKTHTDNENQRIIENLKSKVEELKSKLNETKHELTMSSYRQESPREQIRYVTNNVESRTAEPSKAIKEQIKQYRNHIESIEQKNEELETKNKSLIKRMNEIEQNKKSFTDQITRLEIEVEKYKNETNSVQTVHNETLSELTSLRKALTAKEDVKAKQNEVKEIHRYAVQVDQLEKKNITLKNQIHELLLEQEAQKHAATLQENKISETKAELNEAAKKIDEYSNEINDLRQQLNDRHPLTEEDVFPTHSWRSSEFDTNLSSQIENIASNTFINAPTKLQSIYRIIKQYYTSEIASKDKSLDEAATELDGLKTNLHQFLIDLSIGLSMDAITIDDFIGKNGGVSIMQRVTSLAEAYSDLKKKFQESQLVMQHLNEQFGENPEDDALTIITKTKEQCDENNNIIKQRNSKIRELKKSLNNLKKTDQAKITQLSNENKELKTQNDHLNAKIAELNGTVAKFKSSLQQTVAELKAAKDHNDEIEEKFVDEKQRFIKNSLNEQSNAETQYIQQINNLNKENESLRENVDELEKSVHDLKSSLNTCKNSLLEKEDLIESLMKDKESEIQSITSKLQSEKDLQAQSYENSLSQLRAQCDGHRNDVEELSKTLSNTEKQYNQAKNVVMQLRRDKLLLDKQIATLNEQNERNKKIAESSANAAILEAESSFNDRVDELKNKYETEKRRTFSYAAEELNQFFNPMDSFDERSFKGLIVRAKTEIDRLTSTDNGIRRLVCAGSHQSTEEAVAQLLLK